MNTLSPTITRLIRRQADRCINPSGNVGEIKINDDRLMIEVLNFDFSNFIDSASLMSLLRFLHEQGFCQHSATMWVGMFDGQLYVWAKL